MLMQISVEKNLNVLFDKNSDTGLIYKNDIDKFTNIKSDELIILIMYKQYNHLNNFYDDIKNNKYTISQLDEHKTKIDEKYNNFSNEKDSNVKNYVKNILIDVFDKQHDNIIEKFLEFDKYNNPNKLGF
jgi:hypothetical protein